MFRGSSKVALDAKGRMALPVQFRERLRGCSEGRVVTTVSPSGERERCLWLYPLPEWEALQAKLARMSNLRPAVRRLHRLLIGHAADGELDANGRLLLPAMLREYAELEKKVVLLGLTNKIEIWSEANMQRDRGDWFGEDLASEVAELEGMNELSF